MFGYALFFMNADALKYLDSSQGSEVGVGPSVVVVDQGLAKKFSTATLTQDIYAVIFGQKGSDGRRRQRGLEDHQDPVNMPPRPSPGPA